MANSITPSNAGLGHTPCWYRWQYWVPLLTIAVVVLLNSAKIEYASGPGGEIYGELQGSSTIRRVSYLLLGGVGCLLVASGRLPRKVATQPLLALAAALFTFTLASVFWSEDPSTTFKRSILVACIVVAGFGIGRTWTLEEFTRAICILSSTFLALGIAAELSFGTFLSGGGSYRFSGVFHPAKQAFNCGMLLLASLTFYLRGRNKLMLLLAALACIFLVLTKARTGVGATMIAVVVLVFPYLSRKSLAALGLLSLLATAGLLVYLGASAHRMDVMTVATMGRDRQQADPTKLTGRLTIWTQALEEFADQPVLGYGYGAFWTINRQTEFARRNGWAPAHSHSGYIESLLSLGFLGLMMLVVITLFVLSRSLRFRHAGMARFVAAFVTLAMVGSLTETAFVSDGYQLICLVAGTFLIAYEPSIHWLARNAPWSVPQSLARYPVPVTILRQGQL